MILNFPLLSRPQAACGLVLWVCTIPFFAFAQAPVRHPAHASQILLKVKAQSALWSEIQAVQRSNATTQQRVDKKEVPETWNLAVQANDLTTPLLSTAYTLGVERLWGLLPNIDRSNREALQCGLERIFVAELRTGQDVEALLQKLAAPNSALNLLAASLEYAEPDFIGSGGGVEVSVAANDDKKSALLQSLIPNDSFFGSQWGLRNTGQTFGGNVGKIGADANLTPVWSMTQGSDTLILAVLDSGQPVGAATMPDFAGRLMQGYDFVNNDSDPTDDHGHGSNVMSIATARGNNGAGIAGVDWRCRIMHVKILNSSNSGQYSWWINGIRYAVDMGAKVLNMSVGGSGRSTALEDAVKYAHSKGAIVLACTMNTNSNTTFYPAGYAETIAVGATNNRDLRAAPFCFSATSGSNYGAHLDVVAPGELIAGYRHTDGAVTTWCGTSQATPIVSGIVSLMLSVHPRLTFTQVREILRSTAIDRIGAASEDTQGWDEYFGAGRVNAEAALQAALRITSVQNTNQNINQTGTRIDAVYPQPASNEATFLLSLEQPSRVKFTLFTMLGQEITTIADKILSAGQHTLVWECGNMPSGVYVYRAEMGGMVRGGVVNVVR
ncbi:MAG: S8 family peptidase [Candidatus Kapabacteria bacterium]|jgi:subtilisin family serine protease|nr:S8 family peptidase [Candidatus Kapabacteria bacterium]